MRIEVRPTADDAAGAAADAIARHLVEAAAGRGTASLAVSGGTTPRQMVEHLRHAAVPWSEVHLFQVDEREVPLGDAARNWSQLDDLPALLPPDHRHPMPVEDEDAPAAYAATLASCLGRPPVIDVVHLGLGADGHTASLVPGDATLEDQTRDVVRVRRFRGHRRLTLTVAILRRARHQVWLVTGRDKAGAVRALTAGDPSSVGALVARTDAELYLDHAAAAQLEE